MLGKRLGLLYIILYLLFMSSHIEEDFLDAGIGNELKGVFNKRDIGQRKKALIRLSL